jgi:peptide/nickel transport system permease protein
MRNRLGRIGVVIVGIFILVSIGAPLIAPYDPIEIFPGDELLPPSLRYLLGTDELGRDILSRILYGGRIAFAVGLLAVFLAFVVGALSGLVAGYAGGIVDSTIMRLWDMVMAFPPVLLAVGVVAILGPGSFQSAIALAVINFPRFSRLARGNVLKEKEKEYVVAAHSIGVGTPRVLFRHILPNILSTLLVQFALALVWAVLLEATLSFLGLGTQPPHPSWGSMLKASRSYLRLAPWYAVFPGATISLLLLGLNTLADAVRDALDPTRIRRLA